MSLCHYDLNIQRDASCRIGNCDKQLPGNGSVPPVLPGHTLRALLGEEVLQSWLSREKFLCLFLLLKEATSKAYWYRHVFGSWVGREWWNLGAVGMFAVYLVFNLKLQALFSTLQTDICLTYVFLTFQWKRPILTRIPWIIFCAGRVSPFSPLSAAGCFGRQWLHPWCLIVALYETSKSPVFSVCQK